MYVSHMYYMMGGHSSWTAAQWMVQAGKLLIWNHYGWYLPPLHYSSAILKLVDEMWISYLTVELYSLHKVTQQVVGVAQVPVGPPLSSSVAKLFDQTQVHPTHPGTRI